jgi:hypothetical protein
LPKRTPETRSKARRDHGVATSTELQALTVPSCGRSLKDSSKALSAIPKFGSVAFTCSKD